LKQCNICGGETFVPGFNGRLTFGVPPECGRCRSSERHRIVHGLFEIVAPVLKAWRVLHFAPDGSVEKGWFKEYVSSSYGGYNSLDLQDTGLPDGAFDLVLSNHVLEHVANDVAAMREMLRIVGQRGVVCLTVPTPSCQWSTRDWGFPDPKINYHYRDYGADFPNRLVRAVPGLRAVVVIKDDPVTSGCDLVYFCSMAEERLRLLAQHWQRIALPLVRVE